MHQSEQRREKNRTTMYFSKNLHNEADFSPCCCHSVLSVLCSGTPTSGFESFALGANEGEMETTDTQLELFSVAPDSNGSISFSPETISIVIEDEVVISKKPAEEDEGEEGSRS